MSLLYWLYEKSSRSRARTVARHIERLLLALPGLPKSAWGQQILALVAEAKADLPTAIRHRREEIRLIKRRPGFDASDLADTYDLLAILQRRNGELDAALRSLRQSERLCSRNAIAFEGKAVLDDLEADIATRDATRGRRR